MKVLAILFFLSLSSLYSATFYDKLTPKGRELYDSLDEEYKKKAEQFSQRIPNANQAVFLSAQEALSHKQTAPPPSAFNQLKEEPKKLQSPHFPTQNMPSWRQSLPRQGIPYTQTPYSLRGNP